MSGKSKSPSKPKSSGKRYSSDTKAAAIAAAKRGDGVPSIAKSIGAPQKTVREWIKSAKIRISRVDRRKHDRKAILKAIHNGVPRAEIQAKHGCSPKFISDVANGKIK